MKTLKQLTKSREKRESIHKAIEAGILSGDKYFNLIYDRSLSILAALDNAGFKITRKPKS